MKMAEEKQCCICGDKTRDYYQISKEKVKCAWCYERDIRNSSRDNKTQDQE
jgi:hypothetical protein